MEEELVNPSPLVLQALNKMVLSATLFAKLVITELVQFAGKVAQMASLILVLTASSLPLMEEALDTPAKVLVKRAILKDARRMVFSTIPIAKLTSTTLAVVFALPTVLLDGPISESPVKREVMVEALALLLCALLTKMKMLVCAIRNAIVVTRELDQSVGAHVPLE